VSCLFGVGESHFVGCLYILLYCCRAGVKAQDTVGQGSLQTRFPGVLQAEVEEATAYDTYNSVFKVCSLSDKGSSVCL
jgi:hypothetical protein